jgi:uncharacterized membrane protein YbhN (UPF0104 family)
MKSLIKFILFISVGLVILYFVYDNQSSAYALECQCKAGCEHDNLIDKLIFDFKNTNIFWLGIVCLAFMISNLSRALRWNMLIEPLGYKPKTFNTFFATMIGYMINLALPRAGEVAKPAAVSRYEKIPLEKLFGTIVVDRIFDVLMLLIVTGFTFLTQFAYIYGFLFGEKAPNVECVEGVVVAEQGTAIPWLTLFWSAVGFGLVLLIFVVLNWKKVKEWGITQKLIALFINFLEGIKTVFQLKRPVMFIVHTLVIWLMYYLMMYLCFFAYQPTSELAMSAGLLAFVFGAFGMVIPSPGGMGTYQIAVTAALVIYGIGEADAFAFSNIIFFTITLFCNIFFGILAYIVLPIYNRGYEPSVPTDQA